MLRGYLGSEAFPTELGGQEPSGSLALDAELSTTPCHPASPHPTPSGLGAATLPGLGGTARPEGHGQTMSEDLLGHGF